MFETMTEYQGVGLAAPQVHESVRLFVAGFAPAPGDEDDEMERVPLMALINPEISRRSMQTVEDWEGCLSIPDIRGKVPRARQIVVRAWIGAASASSCGVEFHRAGDSARDRHLDGVLFDLMKSFETLTFLDEFGRYWNERAASVKEE